MHTSVIRSPQAMSNEQSYRPRSPDLPAHTEPQHHQPPRLSRLPSYQIQEPTLPKGYSFSPRGSYDASPFFSQALQQLSNQKSPINQADSHFHQSPPRFTPASLPDQPQIFSPISYTEPSHRPQFIDPLSRPPFDIHQRHQFPEQPYQLSADEMARLRSRKPVNYNDDHQANQYEDPITTYQQPPVMHQMPPQPQHFAQHPPLPQTMQQQMPIAQQHLHAPVQPPPQPITPPMSHVDVKTKFPVARIKRIMQADEDVGKVAQATPTAVSKALELFMIALVTKGAAEAKNNNSKRVTATHLKHALLTDPQFDFLNEICEAVPDEGGKGSKSRAKSEAKSEDSDEDMGGMPKKKGKGGKKKRTDDDDGSD